MSTKNTSYRDSTEYAEGIINYLYILLMFTVYILILHNRYFDVTKTKYACFMCVTLIYIASLGFIRFIKLMIDRNGVKAGKQDVTDAGKCRNIPAYMMMLFMAANMFACFMGDSHAIYGDQGRFMGFLTYTVIGLAFILLSYDYKGYDSLYIILASVIILTLIFAIIQHTGYDLFGLKQNIKPKQYKKFISTFGNINIFASYLVMVIGVAVGAYMYVRKSVEKHICIIIKALYGVVLFLLGMTVMTANSDSVYMGMGVIILLAFILAYRQDKLKDFLQASFLLASGNLVMTIWHTKMENVPSYGGLTRKLDNVKLALVVTAAVIVFYGLVELVERLKRKYNRPKLNKNIGTAVICVIAVCGIALFVAKGIKSGDSLFKFDYKWGTYRGYIWTKSVETFQDAPVINKIFGYGNESIRQVITVPNYAEMLEATDRVYDNAHNEILQYLVTLGLFGVISYVLLVGGSVWYMLKYGRRDMHIYISLFAVAGYFTQAIVNINQPITTPLYFLFMAMGVGYATYCKKNEEET